MIGLIFMAYLLGCLGVISLIRAAVRADPECMPGGGAPAILAITLLWPLVVALLVVGIVMYGVSEL